MRRMDDHHGHGITIASRTTAGKSQVTHLILVTNILNTWMPALIPAQTAAHFSCLAVLTPHHPFNAYGVGCVSSEKSFTDQRLKHTAHNSHERADRERYEICAACGSFEEDVWIQFKTTKRIHVLELVRPTRSAVVGVVVVGCLVTFVTARILSDTVLCALRNMSAHGSSRDIFRLILILCSLFSLAFLPLRWILMVLTADRRRPRRLPMRRSSQHSPLRITSLASAGQFNSIRFECLFQK